LRENPDLKERAKNADPRLKYFLAPMRDDNKESKYFPLVLNEEALLTEKGIIPRKTTRR